MTEEQKQYARDYHQRRKNDPEYRAIRNRSNRKYWDKLRADKVAYSAFIKRKNAGRQRLREALTKFNLTPEQYHSMHDAQGGLCAICQKPETAVWRGKVRRLAVDHDHVTSKVRQLLCGKCNAVLGMSDDNILILEAAIAYLKKHFGK